MAKPVIFLVHGMGTHGVDWSKPVQAALKDVAKQYAYFQGSGRSLGQRVKFVEIRYDDVFDRTIQGWKNAADELRNIPNDQIWLRDVIDWMERADEATKGLVLSHAMDVVLYRFYPPVRSLVQTTVIDQLGTEIDRAIKADAGTRISVIAHSLGTAVAHDALHHLATHAWGGRPSGFAPNLWRPTSITMLANTSRLLEGSVHQADSVIRPGPAGSPDSYCLQFNQFHHDMDPVAWPKRPDLSAFDSARTTVRPVNHYHDANIHGFAHYLLHPTVHIPVLGSAVSILAVTSAEEMQALSGFPSVGGSVAGSLDPYIDAFDRVKEVIGDDPTPLDYVKGIAIMYKFIRDRGGSEV